MNKLLFVITISGFLFSCKNTMQDDLPVTADKNATREASEMLATIKEVSSHGYLLGHQDSPSYGIGWKENGQNLDSDVKRVTGDFPALFGWDLGWLELDSPYNLDTVDFEFIKKTIVEVAEMGALNTVSWHSNNPVTGESTWSPKVTIRHIFDDEQNLARFHGWLEKVADFFLSLKMTDGSLVPVVFRPFHENDGSWFWWGEDHCTPEEYRQIWQYTFKTLTEELGVHNLLFAYSPNNFTTREQYLDKYPGDDYVDILGFDIYYRPDTEERYISVVRSNFEILKALTEEKNKPFAFTETGFESIPSENWYSSVVYPLMKNSGASWVLFWRNYSTSHHYVPFPGHMAEDDFKTFCGFPETLLLNDLNSIK